MSVNEIPVSVIVPVYNVEKYIDHCVDTILRQSMDQLEIILVDDGSTDSSGNKCDFFACQDSRIRVIHKKNEGLGYARNSGLGIASGKYVVFIDSDDYIGPDRIEKLYSYIERTGADVCIGAHTKVTEDGTETVFHNPLAGKIYRYEEIRQVILPGICGGLKVGDNIEMSACMSIYRRDVIEKNNIQFPSERELISEDLIFNLAFFSKASCVTMLDEPGYYYRYNAASLSHRYLAGRFFKQKHLFLTVDEMTREMGLFELCHPRNVSTFTGWARGHVKMEQGAWKKIGLKKSLRNIRDICGDEVLQEALRELDESELPVRSRMVNRLIQQKAYVLLWCFSGLQQAMKKDKRCAIL